VRSLNKNAHIEWRTAPTWPSIAAGRQQAQTAPLAPHEDGRLAVPAWSQRIASDPGNGASNANFRGLATRQDSVVRLLLATITNAETISAAF
jgi:hypothetical protein